MKQEFIIKRLSNLKHRIFPRPFERLGIDGENLIGAEIGVYKGEHAESLLENLSIKRLYLIDSYEDYTDYKDAKRHYGYDQDILEDAEKEAKERLEEKFYFHIKWIREKSINALKDIPDKLDFVYIDGNHEYEFVREDIKNYYPKIKKGGILGGHDFYNGFCQEHNGVINAVTEFIVKNKLQLHVELPDWWIIK